VLNCCIRDVTLLSVDNAGFWKAYLYWAEITVEKESNKKDKPYRFKKIIRI
jgi:hypothetical protein